MASGWFALDPVTKDTGSLGSRWVQQWAPVSARVPHEREADVVADAHDSDGGRLPDVEVEPARFAVRVFDVSPGDVVFFHPRVLHAALGSAPCYPRRTFSVRFWG